MNHSRTSPQNAHKATRKAVRTPYSEPTLRSILIAKNRAGKSYRAIANEYGYGITYGDIARIIKYNIFPAGAAKRFTLNLPALILAPACPKCGESHPIRHPRTPKTQYRDWFDTPVSIIRAAFANRKEYK